MQVVPAKLTQSAFTCTNPEQEQRTGGVEVLAVGASRAHTLASDENQGRAENRCHEVRARREESGR